MDDNGALNGNKYARRADGGLGDGERKLKKE